MLKLRRAHVLLLSQSQTALAWPAFKNFRILSEHTHAVLTELIRAPSALLAPPSALSILKRTTEIRYIKGGGIIKAEWQTRRQCSSGQSIRTGAGTKGRRENHKARLEVL